MCASPARLAADVSRPGPRLAAIVSRVSVACAAPPDGSSWLPRRAACRRARLGGFAEALLRPLRRPRAAAAGRACRSRAAAATALGAAACAAVRPSPSRVRPGTSPCARPRPRSARYLSAAVPLPPATMAPGVAHALAGRRRDAGDIGHDRLGDEAADEVRGRLLVAAADLAHQNDAFGLRIALEQLEHVDEVHAAHRIAADADAGALPEADAAWSGTPPRR